MAKGRAPEVVKRGRGHPRIVETPEEFERLVDEYLDHCAEEGVPVTFTGLSLWLGFADRRSFYHYKEAPQFTRAVTRAQSLIELEYEKKLSGQNVTGSIFALKNHGWSDRQQFEHMGEDGGPMEIVVTRRIVRPDES